MSETQYRVKYLRRSGYPIPHLIMDTLLVHPQHIDIVVNNQKQDIVSVEEVPWCGWTNTWKDSGDRGAAQADHDRNCDICPV